VPGWVTRQTKSFHIGWVYRARKEYDLAISSIQKAAELNPESTIVFYHLGLTYMEQGNNAQAASALNKVLSLDSKSQDAVLARELLAKIKTN
jgi:tetratricopeptide (TPR) repeat protein